MQRDGDVLRVLCTLQLMLRDDLLALATVCAACLRAMCDPDGNNDMSTAYSRQ